MIEHLSQCPTFCALCWFLEKDADEVADSIYDGVFSSDSTFFEFEGFEVREIDYATDYDGGGSWRFTVIYELDDDVYFEWSVETSVDWNKVRYLGPNYYIATLHDFYAVTEDQQRNLIKAYGFLEAADPVPDGLSVVKFNSLYLEKGWGGKNDS